MKRILVIEDTPEMRELIVESLSQRGYDIMSAVDGLQGVELAQKHLPDLILCDLNMPRLDGYGALSRLKQDTATATIPFIFLTGVSERLNVRRGMEMGAADYLTKPFTFGELMAAVEAQIKKQEVVQRVSEKRLEELRGNIILSLPHELRTPLNGIIGLTSILVEDHATMPPGEVRGHLEDIYRSALRLHRLIENFLVYSQIELMAAEPDRVAALRNVEFIPVGKLLSDLVLQKALKARRASDLAIEIIPANLPVPTENLKRIVEEILDNAFKFSEPGTPVRVATSFTDTAFVISITDHGRGMSAGEIASVGAHMQFQRKFYEQQGAGLGLIIAKRLTELHGGSLAIESTPGRETTIRIIFPTPG